MNINRYAKAILFAVAGIAISIFLQTHTSQAAEETGDFRLLYDSIWCNQRDPIGPAVYLDWDDVDGATRYEVYRNGLYYTNTATDSFFENNINLVAGNSYEYYILAKKSNGTEKSDTISVPIPENICSYEKALNIISNPTGAIVYIDGEERGVTPLMVDNTNGISHTIRLTKSGYQEYESNFFSSADWSTFRVTLIPLTPACRDGVDNDGDGGTDARDCGCHTDGKEMNRSSYDPEDTSEGGFCSSTGGGGGGIGTGSVDLIVHADPNSFTPANGEVSHIVVANEGTLDCHAMIDIGTGYSPRHWDLLVPSLATPEIIWDGRDGNGQVVSAGNYIYTATCAATGGGGFSDTETGVITILDKPESNIDTDKDCLSDEKEKQIGTDTNKADTDGDGLWDGWEAENLDMENGCEKLELDLVAHGANPLHKDIFLEIDWMEDDNHSHKPSDEAVQKVIDAFDRSPVQNPDENKGIKLHVDLSNGVPHHKYVSFFGLAPGIANFDGIKADPINFDQKRKRFFRYALFGHDLYWERFAALGEHVIGVSEFGGDDLMVALGDADNSIDPIENVPIQIYREAETLMHELGHSLRLKHGGDDNTTYKPNYLSVMNYAFSKGLISRNSQGVKKRFIDYSSFEYLPLNEDTLIEEQGILRSDMYTRTYNNHTGEFEWVRGGLLDDSNANSIDWNRNGKIDTVAVDYDVNHDYKKNTLNSHNDWEKLGQKGWEGWRFQDSLGYLFGVGERVDDDIEDEITHEEIERLGLDDVPVDVKIDIKPGSEDNPINISSKGVVPVAIISSDLVDARTVLVESVVFGGSQSVKNSHLEDVNKDGFDDLVLNFNTETLNITSTESVTERITLTGKTVDKKYILGQGSIKIVPRRD